MTLPIQFSDLPRNAQLALTIYDCGGPNKLIPVGGTTISLFSKHGVFRTVCIVPYYIKKMNIKKILRYWCIYVVVLLFRQFCLLSKPKLVSSGYEVCRVLRVESKVCCCRKISFVLE